MAIRSKIVCAAAAATLAGIAAPASAQLELLYTFEDGTDTTIENSGNGPDGTLVGPTFSFIEGTPSGRALQLNGDNNTFIDTNALHSALIGAIGRNPTPAAHDYTMTSVVTLSGTVGDNMIFGDNPGTGDGSLHNGFREANLHQGHWGGDTTGGAATLERVHVAYRYSDLTPGGDLEQEIFLNGVRVAGPATQPGLFVDENMFIGTSANNGGLEGIIDNVRVFSGALSDAEIASLAVSDLTFVPEPSGLALLGVGAAGLLTRKRRK